MSDTLTREIFDLEALLEEEIPCMGLSMVGPCPQGASAQWRGIGSHGHPISQCPMKCDQCYTAFRQRVEGKILAVGFVECAHCGHRSTSFEEHSRYIRL